MFLFSMIVLVLVVTLALLGERVLLRDPVRASTQLRRRLRDSTRPRR